MPTVLNYLGYMLADRGVKLPEALKLIRKAVELEPQNGAYLDSLGWVYFKSGQYAQAEENLRKANERMNTDPTVHDHLGEVYEKTGNLKMAVAQWERSMTEYAHRCRRMPILRTCKGPAQAGECAGEAGQSDWNSRQTVAILSVRLDAVTASAVTLKSDYGNRSPSMRGRRRRGRSAFDAACIPRPCRPSRTAFQRDRERIVQARAFRRLAGKTQVFTSRASDHFRSRLTHTIEVAQIARGVAATLGLNEDLAETLALVHDIGHPPFGHAGERALDDCLKRHGRRFDHNLHALRIVEHFEQRYAAHRGLNLTLGVREGIIKHSRDYSVEQHPELAEYLLGQRPPLEAQIIDLADEIAYLTADLDDGVESGLLEIGHIREHVDILGALLSRGGDASTPGSRRSSCSTRRCN